MASRKRKHQITDEPNRKLHIVAAKKTLPMPLKLSDLNDDVIGEIFSYLSAEDLVNVVNMDDVFLASCSRAFQRNYKNKCIKLPLRETGSTTGGDDFIKNAQLLRYFGEDISKLEFTIDNDNPMNLSIYHLMVVHCHETLTEIKFLYPSTELKIYKCFKKLTTMTICHGSVDQSMCQFGTWFPVLENLFVNYVDNVKYSKVRAQIGHNIWTFNEIVSLNLSPFYPNVQSVVNRLLFYNK